MGKRFVSIFMIAVLLFAGATPAFAEAEVKPELKVTEGEDNGAHVVTATVAGAEEVKGTFTFTGVGEEQSNETGEVRYEGLESGSHQVEVTFDGIVDGVELTLNGSLSFEVKGEGDESAKEEENGDETSDHKGDKESENKPDEEKSEDGKLMVSPFFFIGEESGIALSAELLGEAKGKWSFTLDGKKPEEWYEDYDDEEGVTYAEAFYTVAKPGTHKAVVTFKGTVDGKSVDLKEELVVDFPTFGFELTHDGKATVGGKFTQAKKAEGDWFIALGDFEDEFMLDFAEAEGHKGLSFSHNFKGIKPGTYFVFVGFFGEVDGLEVGAFDEALLVINKDGSGTLKPIDDEGPVVTDPDYVEDIIDEAKKGGKLPNTATSLPLMALFGGLLLAAGLGMLTLRGKRAA
ncbi:hypothetical protein [Desmospora profundinema]|uniref:Gram-positive cocci surface proteins LPxTG domain-containing protein n=1 Tax=Desmospora profundinema TaxID=1571184 RepID=A0ABU1IP60_9BACL|nr:hypothetical protein [Desmospora profundinema]MDR6226572.1 hypothetical protein [Desmospora profundinema]